MSDIQRQYNQIEPGKLFCGRVVEKWHTYHNTVFYQTVLIRFTDCSTMLHNVWKY